MKKIFKLIILSIICFLAFNNNVFAENTDEYHYLFEYYNINIKIDDSDNSIIINEKFKLNNIDNIDYKFNIVLLSGAYDIDSNFFHSYYSKENYKNSKEVKENIYYYELAKDKEYYLTYKINNLPTNKDLSSYFDFSLVRSDDINLNTYYKSIIIVIDKSINDKISFDNNDFINNFELSETENKIVASSINPIKSSDIDSLKVIVRFDDNNLFKSMEKSNYIATIIIIPLGILIIILSFIKSNKINNIIRFLSFITFSIFTVGNLNVMLHVLKESEFLSLARVFSGLEMVFGLMILGLFFFYHKDLYVKGKANNPRFMILNLIIKPVFISITYYVFYLVRTLYDMNLYLYTFDILILLIPYYVCSFRFNR